LDRKDRIETADRKNLAHIRREAEQRHLALGLLHLLGHHQQDPQPGAADVVQLCHIDRQTRRAAGHGRVEPVLGRFGGAAVEAPRQPDDNGIARLFLREFHEQSPARADYA
jgi:hypothetical protein